MGCLGFFCTIKINHDSSGAYVQRSECKDKYAWNIAWRTMFVDIFCLRLLPCVWSANTPHLEVYGWRHHYMGQYRSSGISFLYLWHVAHQKGILLQCFSSYGWKSTDKKYIFQFWDDILWEEMKWNDYANTWKTLEGGNENEITSTCPNPPSKVVQYHIWFQPGTVSLITLHGSPDRYHVITHIFLF